MQTKKRAKPVKFGKAAQKEESTSKVAATEEKKVISSEVEEPTKEVEQGERPSEESVPAPVEKEDEPMEVRLSEPPKDTSDDIFKDVEPVEEEPEEAETKKEPLTDGEPTSSPQPPSAPETELPSASSQPEPLPPVEPEKPSPFGSFTYTREERRGKGGKMKLFIIVALVAFLIGLALIAGISYFNTKSSDTLPFVEKTTPTAIPTVEPTATPTPEEVDLSAYTIQILNGSGITGEAAKVKTELVDAGFKVGEVGNADTSDYTKTVIAAKKTVSQDYLDELMAILKKSYSVNSAVETLPDVDQSDVVITIGSTTSE